MSSHSNSLASLFHYRVNLQADRRAMMRKTPAGWQGITFRELEEKVAQIATTLQAMGFKKGDRLALLAQTSPEWTFFDFATLSLGGVTVPVYPSLTADEVHFILKDSGASVLVVEDSRQRAKVEALRAQLPDLKKIITLEKNGVGEIAAYTDWVSAPSPEALQKWKDVAPLVQSHDLATIVYTSGTTGQPKGAQLSHQNFLSTMEVSMEALGLRSDDLTLLFLPTAHILGRMEQMFILGVGWTTAYAEGFAGLMENMAELRPTLLVSVPRIYEKFYAAIQSKMSGGSPRSRRLFEEAVRVGRAYSQTLQRGEKPGLVLRARYYVAERLIFRKVREKFGGRLRFTISGGAPLSAEIAEFFHACGILILEGYGLTETTGPLAVNRPNRFRFGSTGIPGRGVEVKIASDGEILIKGPTIFSGYFGRPDLTNEAMTDGYFATGDIGNVDSEGFLTITDRKKDLIVTAAGKNIAPQKIENLVKADPLFSNIVVFGDKQKFLVALLAINAVELRRIASGKGVEFKSVSESTKDPEIAAVIKKRFDAINNELASFERVKKFKILSRELSMEAGELTPSLKVKRKFCEQKYAPVIEEMYQI